MPSAARAGNARSRRSRPRRPPRHMHELDGATAADLLGERAGETLERPLGACASSAQTRTPRAGCPSTITLPQGCERRTSGERSCAALCSSLESVMPVASNTSALEALPVSGLDIEDASAPTAAISAALRRPPGPATSRTSAAAELGRDGPKQPTRRMLAPRAHAPADERGTCVVALERHRPWEPQASEQARRPAASRQAAGSGQLIAYPGSHGRLEHRNGALSRGGADADHAAPAARSVKRLGERGDDPPAGRGERVARRRASPR